jgi:hypothetical protein
MWVQERLAASLPSMPNLPSLPELPHMPSMEVPQCLSELMTLDLSGPMWLAFVLLRQLLVGLVRALTPSPPRPRARTEDTTGVNLSHSELTWCLPCVAAAAGVGAGVLGAVPSHMCVGRSHVHRSRPTRLAASGCVQGIPHLPAVGDITPPGAALHPSGGFYIRALVLSHSPYRSCWIVCVRHWRSPHPANSSALLTRSVSSHAGGQLRSAQRAHARETQRAVCALPRALLRSLQVGTQSRDSDDSG